MAGARRHGHKSASTQARKHSGHTARPADGIITYLLSLSLQLHLSVALGLIVAESFVVCLVVKLKHGGRCTVASRGVLSGRRVSTHVCVYAVRAL